jgi:hypothetical protein
VRTGRALILSFLDLLAEFFGLGCAEGFAQARPYTRLLERDVLPCGRDELDEEFVEFLVPA